MGQKDLNRLCLIQWCQHCNPQFPSLEGTSSEWYFLFQELQLKLAFLVCLSTIVRLNYCNTFLRNLIYFIQTFLPVRGFQKTATAQRLKSPGRKQLSENKTPTLKKSSEFQPDQVFGYLQTPLGALSTKCTWKVTKVFEWWTPAYCWPAENERFDRNGKEKGDPAFQILTEGSNQFNFNNFKAVSFCAYSSIWLYNV